MGIVVVGAGIAGLTLALALQKRGVPCRIFEAAHEISKLGVGINLLPHAVEELQELGLREELLALGVATEEHLFFTRHGQMVYGEPRGQLAGYEWPQISIHRADLHSLLLETVQSRLGDDSVVLSHRCVGADQSDDSVLVHFCNAVTGEPLPSQRGCLLIGCDGIHSAIRKQLFPKEQAPRYSGINMWRGTVQAKPFLSGRTMVHIGWYATGNIVAYPIRDNVDGKGAQLINWVASIETPLHERRRWDRMGRREDFAQKFENFVFDWIDVPQIVRDTKLVLEYPMVDQDPLDHWTDRRITLLGDAAHPMYPRGSNGAGQAILDARCLADLLAQGGDPLVALQSYEAIRRPATTNVVLINRRNPPDAVLREVYERTGDQPFDNINDYISEAELREIVTQYKRVAGFDHATLERKKMTNKTSAVRNTIE